MDLRAHERALGGPGAAIGTPSTRRIHAHRSRADAATPGGHSLRVGRSKATEELAVAQGDGVKALSRAADVDADDDFGAQVCFVR